jgi:hypothetical protein
MSISEKETKFGNSDTRSPEGFDSPPERQFYSSSSHESLSSGKVILSMLRSMADFLYTYIFL